MNLSVFTKPYPLNDTPGAKWRIIILFGVFISFFLLIFKPFGLGEASGILANLVLTGYGFVTMILLFINLIVLPLIFKSFFKEDNWVVYKEIAWILFIVFTIGLGNFIYTRLIFSYPEFSISGILAFQFYTLAIAFLPVSALILISQNRLLKKYLEEANLLNDGIVNQPRIKNPESETERITLLAENLKDKLEIKSNDLLFIESFGNYVKIHFREDEKEKVQVLRSTLKRLEADLSEYKNLFQCHRAFLVNISNIKNVSGNAQGYKLKLTNSNSDVPVARSYIHDFKEIMN